MATVRDFVCFKANCTETALFIKLCKPPTCDVNNAMYYHALIRLPVPRALVANKVYSMNALIKTIHFEIFSSLLLPKGKSFAWATKKFWISFIQRIGGWSRCESCFVNKLYITLIYRPSSASDVLNQIPWSLQWGCRLQEMPMKGIFMEDMPCPVLLLLPFYNFFMLFYFNKLLILESAPHKTNFETQRKIDFIAIKPF